MLEVIQLHSLRIDPNAHTLCFLTNAFVFSNYRLNLVWNCYQLPSNRHCTATYLKTLLVYQRWYGFIVLPTFLRNSLDSKDVFYFFFKTYLKDDLGFHSTAPWGSWLSLLKTELPLWWWIGGDYINTLGRILLIPQTSHWKHCTCTRVWQL